MDNRILARKRWLSRLALAALLLVLALAAPGQAAEEGDFSGTWVANGTRELFPFGPDRKVYLFDLSGHVNLQTGIGKKDSYWASCVGLSDTSTGVVARCVWKSLAGPEIYLTLSSVRLAEKHQVTGAIIGGSEHLAGITGELSFIWESVFIQDRDKTTSTFTGQTLDLKGTYQIP